MKQEIVRIFAGMWFYLTDLLTMRGKSAASLLQAGVSPKGSSRCKIGDFGNNPGEQHW